MELKRLFIGCLLLGASSLFAGQDWQPQVIGPFGTLNNRDNSFAIPAQNAQDLLNVNITPGGKSVFKRKGYGSAFTLTYTTSPVHGIYNFYDSNGNDVSLFFHDSIMSASISGGTPSILFSTGSFGATYQCTDSLGFAYCANTSRTTLTKTNGGSYSNIQNVTSTGTMVTSCVTRLAIAGFSDAPSRIDFSADTDFTTWGTGSLGTSAAQFTINAPGPKITHITYAFGRLMWFKDTSFGYILIGNQPAQSDWVIRTISYDVGTNDNSSVYREGVLYFRGKDGHIYMFDGSNYQRISREIAGTISGSQSRTSNAWTQTSQSDFQAGISTPTAYLSFTNTPGSVVVDTTVAVLSQTDTNDVDFAAGTLTSVSTNTIPNSLVLSFTTQNAGNKFYPGSDNSQCASLCTGSYYQARLFIPTATAFASAAVLRLKKTGSPGDSNVDIMSDVSGTPSQIIETVICPASSVSTSVGDVTVNFTSTTVLTSGTTYWLRLRPLSTCDTSNKIEWYGTGVTNNSGLACGTSIPSGTSYAYKLFVTTYVTSGNFVSRVFDVGKTTNTINWNWGQLDVSGVLNLQTVTFQTQTSSASTGPFEALQSIVPNGNGLTSTVQRYLRYKINFVTTNPIQTAQINDVSMHACFIPSYYSQVENAPNLRNWDSFQATQQGNGGSNTFYIRASTNSFSVASSTPSWTVITSGAIPSISTGTYFQVRDDMSLFTTNQNPKLDDFTQNWFEGSASDKAYATYFDDKIWWSITYGTAATTNNRILLYDMLNQGWLLYDLAADGFLIRQNHLYFGSSTSGNVYKFGDIDNDNGSAINAYWKSKDFFGGDPFTTQEIANISVSAKEVANSSMTITYTLNGSSSTSYTMPLYSATNLFLNQNKNLPSGRVGNTYNVQFGNNAADQPFEVFGVQVGIRGKSWIPTTP